MTAPSTAVSETRAARLSNQSPCPSHVGASPKSSRGGSAKTRLSNASSKLTQPAKGQPSSTFLTKRKLDFFSSVSAPFDRRLNEDGRISSAGVKTVPGSSINFCANLVKLLL